MSSLLELVDIAGRFPNNQTIFEGVAWTWNPGECWAFCGPIASGKSAFLKILDGTLRTVTGERKLSRSVHRVSFQENLGQFQASKYFYQQRFNFVEVQDSLRVREFLTDAQTIDPKLLQEVIDLLELGNLLEREVIALSTGQNRRLRIARALLKTPEILLLDDPFAGLDLQRRERLAGILQRLRNAGVHLGIVCRKEEIPDCCTHVAYFDKGQIVEISRCLPRSRQTQVLPEPFMGSSNTLPVLELENVSVQYGEKKILDKVSWTVKRGERWVLFGENGSGKSTLLSLVVGDHPQAYSNVVKLFGKNRGSGESIWEVKKRIGFFSSEFQMYFPREISVWETIGTGFHDGVYSRSLSDDEKQKVIQLLKRLNLAPLENRILTTLSASEQRLVLLARALIKEPELVILDEPFQGFDWHTIEKLQVTLEEMLSPSQTLVLVTHDPTELPTSVNRVFRLTTPKGN